MDNKLKAAHEALKHAGKVNIRGKDYLTVATRLNVFREHWGHDYGLTTEILPAPDGMLRVRAVITDRERVIATGMAEERRGSSQITKTSALEVCETSAIGRVLANFGLGGSEFASANEVENAMAQSKDIKLTELKVQFKDLVDELNACADEDQLLAFLNAQSTIDLLNTVQEFVPKWFHGGGDIWSWAKRVQVIREGFDPERKAIQEEQNPLGAG